MNSSHFSYLYLHLNNLKTINGFKPFTFSKSLDIPTKTNKKINGGSFCGENNENTFINIKAKAEQSQTKAREACSLLAFAGSRKTIESTNYRVGAKVSGVFGLPTNNDNLHEEPSGFVNSFSSAAAINLLAEQQKLRLCDTARVSGKLNALASLKKYIKIICFSGKKTGKDRFPKSLAVTKFQNKQKNISLSTSFTFLASSENPVGFYHGCEESGLNQQKSENINTAFNQRILNQSFKRNLATHLGNCQVTQMASINNGLYKVKVVPRQSNKLSLTTSAPLLELFNWGNQYDLPVSPFVGSGSPAFTKPKVQGSDVVKEDQSFFSTTSKKSSEEPKGFASLPAGKTFCKKKHKKENIYLRCNSSFERFAQKSLLYKKEKYTLFTTLGDFTRILQNLPTPKFSFLSKQSTALHNFGRLWLWRSNHNHSAKKTRFFSSFKTNLALAEPKKPVCKNGLKSQKNLFPSGPLGPQKKRILEGLWLTLLLKKNAESNKTLLYKKVNLLEAAAGTLTKFYSASWFLEYIRTELSLRNANIRRVLGQAFILAQQPLPSKKKKFQREGGLGKVGFSFSRESNFGRQTFLFAHSSGWAKQHPNRKDTVTNNNNSKATVASKKTLHCSAPQHSGQEISQISLFKTSFPSGGKSSPKKQEQLLLLKQSKQLNRKVAGLEYLGSTARPEQVQFTPIKSFPEGATVVPDLIRGLKITFSGRTGGKKGMAKTLTKTLGRVPLSTLDEKVDFAKGTVQTKVGSLGIKVWICYN